MSMELGLKLSRPRKLTALVTWFSCLINFILFCFFKMKMMMEITRRNAIFKRWWLKMWLDCTIEVDIKLVFFFFFFKFWIVILVVLYFESSFCTVDSCFKVKTVDLTKANFKFISRPRLWWLIVLNNFWQFFHFFSSLFS